MKRLSVLFLVLIIALSGCGKADNAQNQTSNVVEMDNKKETNNEQRGKEDKQETADDNKDEDNKDEEKISDEDNKQPLDEIEAPKREEIKGGVKFTFKRLPMNAVEISKIVDFKDEKSVSAMFIATLVGYFENKDESIAMINVLKGPESISNYDINFLDSQLKEKPYLPNAYFEGATPENNYTPNEPLTIIIYDDTNKSEDGYIRVFVKTTGADSPRGIMLRQKGDEWFIWDYPGILMGVRLPAEQDVWK